MAHNDSVQITLTSYFSQQLDAAVRDIQAKCALSGVSVISIVPMPKRIEKFIVLRSPHVNKKSREQFERREQKRIMRLRGGNIGDILRQLSLPAGVEAKISEARKRQVGE